MLTVGSLFSGIGGLEYGLEQTGSFRTIWHCEIDKYASAVLKKHWQNIPNFGDITKVRWEDKPKPDVVCGGFPCQDISIAGKQRGIEGGARSGLWREFTRCLSITHPKYALVENVGRIQVKGIERIRKDLKELGYTVHPIEISANQIGAYSQRERVFFIAHTSSLGCHNCPSADKEYEIQNNEVWGSSENIREWAGWKRWLNKVSQALDGEITQTDFYGMDDGLPSDMDRIRCLGNAVCPPVGKTIGTILAEIETAPIPPTDKSVGILGVIL